MVKLTEKLVLAKSRASELENVRKLNFWASELTDISIIRKMANVQVISLSVNQITSLEDFSNSLNLEELYIRKNIITNLGEISYLRHLPRLRVLWLADNPCAVGDRYRNTVLRTLPKLQRLDNIPVQEEEVNSAAEQGLDITSLTNLLKPATNNTPQSSPEMAPRSEHINEKPKEEINGKEMYQEDKTEKEPEKILLLADAVTVVENLKSSKEYENDESQTESQFESQIEEASYTTLDQDASQSELITGTWESEEVPDWKGGDMTAEVTIEKEDEGRDTKSKEGQCTEEAEGQNETTKGDAKEEHLEETTSPNETGKEGLVKSLRDDSITQRSTTPPTPNTHNANVLKAVLHLVHELDAYSLQIVGDLINSKLESS